MTDRARKAGKATEPWRQRLIRGPLVRTQRRPRGESACPCRIRDARLRSGLCGDCGRLVMFAIGGDNHGARRTAAQDAIAHRAAGHRRSQRRGARHRRQGTSLFGEPRRNHRQGRGDRAAHRDASRSRYRRGARTGVVAEGFRLAEARNHAAAAAGNTPPRHSRHRLPAREQARLSHRQRSRAFDRPRQHRQSRHRRDGEVGRQQSTLPTLHRAGFAVDHEQQPIELSIDLRVEHALRDELLKAKDKYHAKAASASSPTSRPARSVAMV